ncbi:MAG: CHRD domain-containing protein [Pseudonocardiales bacterium]|jgi:hypothetical protein|nr:CHRD domain-containing protein [Pseudonocardiales bacterium]
MRRTVRRVAVLTALTTSAVALSAGVASAQDADVPEPSSFTSMFSATTTPDNVVNADGEPVPGPDGGTGTWTFRINSDEEIICYDIVVEGITAEYESPARTATHIHEAAAGASGPPRVVFPNPADAGDGTLRSEGCLQGPFTTGVMADGTDTGEGFSLAEIEADPAAYYADVHTADFVPGALRGQLMQAPMGGVDTGAGGTAEGSTAPQAAVAAIGLLGAAGIGLAVARRRSQA